MKDIENVDLDDIEIKNKYSNNPYWQNQTIDNLDMEEWEKGQKHLKENKEKEFYETLINIKNYFFYKNCFIGCSIFFFTLTLIYLTGLIIGIILNDINAIKSFEIITIVFLMFSIAFWIQIPILNKQFVCQKTEIYKKFKKSYKKNKKTINKLINKYTKEEREKIQNPFQ